MGKTVAQQSQALHDLHNYHIDISNREIFLGSLGNEEDNPEIDHRMSISFIKNIRVLDSLNHNPILIHLQTPGGCINSGLAIYDAIKFSQSHVTILGYGLIDSIGTIILQAADSRLLMPNCEFMVHYGEDEAEGNYLAMKSHTAWSEELRNIILNIYAEKCINGAKFKAANKNIAQTKKTLDTILKQKVEWYLNPKECVDFGLADGILGETPYLTLTSIKGA